jgi:curved DNA-binding protein CbpA
MRSELVILELTPPISMADLKSAYRRAAAKHHPDLGGTSEGFIAVNSAYEQLKWEIERGAYQQPYPQPKQPPPPPPPPQPKQPQPKQPETWYEKIDAWIYTHRLRAYKKQWVVYQLLGSEIEPPLEAWIYMAYRFEYKEAWAYFKSEECHTHPRANSPDKSR